MILASEVWQFLIVVPGYFLIALLWLFIVYLPGRTMEHWRSNAPDAATARRRLRQIRVVLRVHRIRDGSVPYKVGLEARISTIV
jgi:hypothetical protein